MSDDSQLKPSKRGISVPGQPTEEAIAEVGTAAGKSLVRGFQRLGGAWIAEREARADAAKLTVETDSKISAAKSVAAARREDELAEVEHQARLQRRIQRLKIELDQQQANIESIEMKALSFTEKDPGSGRATEIDQDWLFKFADSAQRVSDETVQELWARVLGSAAIKDAPRLSAQGLQTLSMFDKRSAEDFQKLVFAMSHLGFFPVLDSRHQQDPQHVNLDALMDLGLIQSNASSSLYQFPGFLMDIGKPNRGLQLLKDRIFLTKRGADIANAVFRGSEFNPGDHFIEEYIRLIVQKEIQNYQAVSLYIPNNTGNASQTFWIEERTADANENWKTHPAYVVAGAALKNLLDWAGIHFKITTSDRG